MRLVVIASLAVSCVAATGAEIGYPGRHSEHPERSSGFDLRRLPPVERSEVRASYEQPLSSVSDDRESPTPALTSRDIAQINFVQPSEDSVGETESYGDQPSDFEEPPEGTFEGEANATGIGTEFNVLPAEFDRGIVIDGVGAAMKISGYVKADFIYDFDPIESTDLFDTTTIPTRPPEDTPHKNSRFHARQSRLNFDVRWPSVHGPVRVFVEGDFFSDGNRYRMRHAYGELGEIIVGQTWTTFTDAKSLPNTLDNEGSASSVALRRAQIRWTQPLFNDDLSLALAIEDPRAIVEIPAGVTGDPRTESPDFIARLRFVREWGQFQAAGVTRQIGFQPAGGPVSVKNAWGFNFTGAILATRKDEVYHQVLFGDGIGSFRGLPDAAPVTPNSGKTLGMFGWMVGWTHDWTDQLSSNFTYGEGRVENTPFQPADDLHQNTYFAINLIWNPVERMFVGIEYLYGTRVDKDRDTGKANRVQTSFGFYLP